MRRAIRRALFVIALVAASALVPIAQQRAVSPDDLARDLTNAERLLREGKTDQAATAFQAAVDAARAAGLAEEEARAQCGLGDTRSEQQQYSQARAPLQQCLEIAERLGNDRVTGRALVALSLAAELRGGQGEAAAAFADRAVALYEALQDPRGRAVARGQLLRVRTFSDAEEESLARLVIADARLAGDRGLEARALHAWGDRLFNEARYEEAFETLTRASDIFREIGGFSGLGTTYNSLGRVYRAHGRLDEALKCQKWALSIHEKLGAPFELMQSLNAVAVVQNQLGDLAGARVHYERALVLARQSSSPRIQDFLNANIASLLLDQGEYEKAARTFEGVIARGLDSYPSLRYSSLSFAYLRLHRTADAIAAAERALEACHDNQQQCLVALESRAAAHSAASDPTAARADIRKALETIEGLRARLLPADFIKQNFHEAQQSVYSAGIAIAFDRRDDRESLETAELASSRAFLDLLAGRNVSPRNGSSNQELTFRGAPAGDLPSVATAAPADASDIAAIATRLHSTVVIYWPADDALYIWVVNRDGSITSRRVEVSKARLRELIAATAPLDRASAGVPAGRREWRRLYDALVAPIRTELPRTPGALLTIIPHGVLTNLSFAALQRADGRYLLEDYAIHYAPAGAVLQFTAGMRRADARRGNALLVADPVTVRPSPLDPLLPPLPGARREAARIAAVIPRSRVTRLEGRDATEPRVTAAAAGKAIVHFATHAIVREQAPNDSYLAFGAGGDSTSGLLTAREVYRLRLSADLVVLSACRSGGGRVTGDGVATFARAFLYAGTPSLVVSLWDVADEPTSRLLPDFYRTWLGGASKARSLRRAQLRLLADLRAGTVRVDTRAGPVVLPEHPMFWAGFVLIGEPE